MSGATRATFPYPEDREVIAHFLAGRPMRGKTQPSAGGVSRMNDSIMVGSVTVAWFNPSDGALMGKLLAGADYHPGVLLVHAVTDMLGASELRVTRESEPLEIRAGARRDASVIGLSPDAERHRFFFAGAPVQIDQPFLICGPMGVRAYRAALKAAPRP